MRKDSFSSLFVPFLFLFGFFMIVISNFSFAGEKLKSLSLKQNLKIQGVVTNAEGEHLSSVSVTLKSGSAGVMTDKNGRYEMENVPENGVLLFSFIGYKSLEVPVKGRTVINVQMEIAETSLDRVVIVGYGSEKKINLTGAIEQIGSEVFEDRPTPNALRALQGQLGGTFINMANGKPSQNYDIVVRGQGSIGAGGRALVLIDGVPGDLSDINPNDIKSVSVIKDASAAAVYGGRGAFGVVLVETKNASNGKMQINYSGNYSVNDRTIKAKLVTNGYEWAKNFSDGFFAQNHNYPVTINVGEPFSLAYLDQLKKYNDEGKLPLVEVDPSTGKYVYYGSSDWQKELYADYNPSTEHNLTISGGDKKFDYLVSGRYYAQKGIYRHSPDNFNQYNFRAKASLQVLKWLKVKNNFSLDRKSYFFPTSSNEFPLANAVQRFRNTGLTIVRIIGDQFPPTATLQNPDGTYTFDAANSMQSFLVGGSFENTLSEEYRNTFGIESKFLNDRLKINGDVSFVSSPEIINAQRTPVVYSDQPDVFKTRNPEIDWASQDNIRNNYLGANISAHYEQRLNKHFFKALIGFNYEKTERRLLSFKRYGLINSSLPDPSLITGDNVTLTGGGYQWTTAGEFFRVNYNYDEKYLLEINGRYDGSSKFPINSQFGFFPSVSGGWRVSRENFWRVSKGFISDFKVRASYGSLGNGNVNPYLFLETLPVSMTARILGGRRVLASSQPNIIPDNLTWETVSSFNLGVDLSFVNNKLNLSFDKYTRKTKDMFTTGIPLPGVFGGDAPKGNFGSMDTKGWEFNMEWTDKGGGVRPIGYSIRFVLSDNYSIISEFNNPEGLIHEYYKGKKLGEIWGYRTDGLFVDEADIANHNVNQSKVAASSQFPNEIKPGDVKFIDLNGDGKISGEDETLQNHGDKVVIGNSQPRYLYGLNASIDWNNFSFSFFIQGIGKRDWFPTPDATYFWGHYARPYTFLPRDTYEKQWSPENPNSYFPRLVSGAANEQGGRELNEPSDRYLQNAAYVRLKNITLGYDIPQKLYSKLGIDRASLYISGQNIFVWSPMFKITRAIDPEGILGASETNAYIPEEVVSNRTSDYPILKTFTIGIKLNFN